MGRMTNGYSREKFDLDLFQPASLPRGLLDLRRSQGSQRRPQRIPAELKALARWVNWQFLERDGNSTKVPVDPNTWQPASSSDRDTWGTYADALARFNSDSVDGIGFQLGDSYVGIDLDRCRNPKTGEIESQATEIIGRLSSYAEISPSGTGIHILTKGILPPHGELAELHAQVFGTAESRNNLSRQQREKWRQVWPPW